MKKILATILALCMIFALCACGAKTEAQPAAPAAPENSEAAPEAQPEKLMEEPLTLNIATSHKDGSFTVTTLQAAFDKITEATNGDLNFVIYTNNQLGKQADVFEQMLNGANILMAYGLNSMSGYGAELAIPGYPYVCNNWDDVEKLTGSDWWAGVMAKFTEEYHAVPVGYMTDGFRNFIGTVPVTSASDLSTVITRVGMGTIGQNLIAATGGTPTTTQSTSDIYSGIQTGMFELGEGNLELLYNNALYEVSKYVSISHHAINPVCWFMNEDIWNSIPEEYQAIFTEELANATRAIYENGLNGEEEWIKKFEEVGMTVLRNEEMDLDSFKALVPYIIEHEGLDMATYESVVGILG